MPEDIRRFLEDLLANDIDAYRRILSDIGDGRAV